MLKYDVTVFPDEVTRLAKITAVGALRTQALHADPFRDTLLSLLKTGAMTLTPAEVRADPSWLFAPFLTLYIIANHGPRVAPALVQPFVQWRLPLIRKNAQTLSAAQVEEMYATNPKL